MSTYRQLIYLVSDFVKELSDDSKINEEHIAFLLDRYRTYLLKQKYLRKAQEIPLSNYQTICSQLQEVPMYPGCNDSCYDDTSIYMRSKTKVTFPLTFSETEATVTECKNSYTFQHNVYTSVEAWEWFKETIGVPKDVFIPEGSTLEDYYLTSCRDDAQTLLDMYIAKGGGVNDLDIITYDESCDDVNAALMHNYSKVNVVSRERFPFVGENKYLKRAIYGTIAPDQYFYIKSKFEGVKKNTRVFLTAIFENPLEAYAQSLCLPCTKDTNDCDEWDYTFPIEDALQTQLLALVIRDCLGAAYRPSDTMNNSRDDLSELEQFIRSNMKDRYIKQTEGNE